MSSPNNTDDIVELTDSFNRGLSGILASTLDTSASSTGGNSTTEHSVQPVPPRRTRPQLKAALKITEKNVFLDANGEWISRRRIKNFIHSKVESKEFKNTAKPVLEQICDRYNLSYDGYKRTVQGFVRRMLDHPEQYEIDDEETDDEMVENYVDDDGDSHERSLSRDDSPARPPSPQPRRRRRHVHTVESVIDFVRDADRTADEMLEFAMACMRPRIRYDTVRATVVAIDDIAPGEPIFFARGALIDVNTRGAMRPGQRRKWLVEIERNGEKNWFSIQHTGWQCVIEMSRDGGHEANATYDVGVDVQDTNFNANAYLLGRATENVRRGNEIILKI